MGVRVSLKALRVNKDLNQDEAAKLVDVSTSTWASWEAKKTFPDVRDVIKIENAFDIRYEDIVFL